MNMKMDRPERYAIAPTTSRFEAGADCSLLRSTQGSAVRARIKRSPECRVTKLDTRIAHPARQSLARRARSANRRENSSQQQRHQIPPMTGPALADCSGGHGKSDEPERGKIWQIRLTQTFRDNFWSALLLQMSRICPDVSASASIKHDTPRLETVKIANLYSFPSRPALGRS